MYTEVDVAGSKNFLPDMNLQEIRQALVDSNFPDDVKNALFRIVDAAIVKGSMADDDKKEILAILDASMVAEKAELTAMKDVAAALRDFAADVDDAEKRLQQDSAKAIKELEDQIQE